MRLALVDELRAGVLATTELQLALPNQFFLRLWFCLRVYHLQANLERLPVLALTAMMMRTKVTQGSCNSREAVRPQHRPLLHHRRRWLPPLLFPLLVSVQIVRWLTLMGMRSRLLM